MVRAIKFAVFAAVILLPAMALAQAPPKAPAPIVPKDEQLDAKGCAQQRATVGEGGDLDSRKGDGRSLSDHLAQSDGVICPPPHVDPAIKAPTPHGGPMPVIPPPGSPGGDPNIRPK